MSIAFVLLPLFVQVVLTFVLGIGMAWNRGRDFRGGLRHSDVALREANWSPRTLQFTYAFANQFEMPVLFYVLTILSIITRHADIVFVVLAWLFVLPRVVQAWIHVTTNNVQLRGAFFGLSTLALLVAWVIFMVRIVFGLP